MSASYTATTFIDADPERVFEYVRVPENQPSWAINFVRSTRPLSDGRYAMQTPAGELIYRIKEDLGAVQSTSSTRRLKGRRL
jgi:uncharacterized protein YndB with AHSA1/START domain